MEVARQFGENLRRLRKRADISQEELGLRCSLHRTEIGLLERGARVPRIDTLIKIASGLGVRIDCALLDGIAWTPGTSEAGGFNIAPDGSRELRKSEGD
jgi:transcriptional regulator with XRE-family HTH domain